MDAQRDAPVYNIKAMSRLTGVPADTLRRWESRYNVIVPERTGSGYRLYSQRDVDTILWLKSKLEDGLSISRACEMLRQMGGNPPLPQNGTAHHTPAQNPAPALPPAGPSVAESPVRSFDALRAELLDALKSVDETRAGEIISEALSLYSVEDVCIRVMQQVLVRIGELWLTGEVSVAVEHFASSFVRARLENLFHQSPYNAHGPSALVGCAPGELHELGAMFLAIFLRRAGYRVVYLGQNVPLDSLLGMIRAQRPDVVCISATRAETAAALYNLRDSLDLVREREGHAPMLAYGGRVFNRFPHITDRLGGVYLGEDARKAVTTLTERLRSG
ncbi:MAG: MerR family transcriptional regulator [Chloroflexota bacterium]|nr:MerR family transcriptional regulator [Chloroflexota bacterium]